MAGPWEEYQAQTQGPWTQYQAAPQQKFGLGDTWPAKLAKSIYSAVTLPGDVYQGNASVPQSENMPGGENTDNIDRVTNLAGVISPAANGTVAGSKVIPPTAPTPQELKSAASAGYDAARSSGIELKPSSMESFVAKTKSDLNSDGLNEVLAPKTFGVLEKMGTPPEGAAVTTNDFRTMQRALGHAAKSPDPTERLSATRAIESLNNHLENIPASDVAKGTPDEFAGVLAKIKEANANYGAYKRAETISGRMDAAQLNAAGANSGQNIDNAMRQQIKGILKSPKLRSGYSADELEQMRKIVAGTSAGNVVRGVGNLLGGGGGLGALASAGAGAYATGGPGAVAPLMGYGVKQLGNKMTANQVSKLEDMIRSRSPLGQARTPVSIPATNPYAAAIASGQLSIPQILGLNIPGIMPLRANQQQ